MGTLSKGNFLCKGPKAGAGVFELARRSLWLEQSERGRVVAGQVKEMMGTWGK